MGEPLRRQQQPPKAALASSRGNLERSRLASSAAATKSSTEENWAVQQAVLNDLLLNTVLHQEFERVPGRDPADVIPLQVGAIAVVENYALAEVFGGVGDLPVIDGYHLLIRQNGQWIVVESLGVGPEIWVARLTRMGVSNETFSRLLDGLRAVGADYTIFDVPIGASNMPCVTRLDDPNPPTNVRITPTTAGNVIGQIPNGTALTVMQPLNGWLKIRQPLVGWMSMNLTRVSCGNSLDEVQRNLDELQLKEEELAIEAADTLVRYLYRGAEGTSAEAAIAHFNGFAIGKFYALEAALNQHTEEVRRQVFQRVIAPGMHPQAVANFNEALLNRSDSSPTLRTWEALKP